MSRTQLLAKAVAVLAATVLPASVVAGVARADPPVAKAVVIGIDGLMYRKIEQAQAPNLLRLAGAGLLSRSSIVPHITISGPSWATVLTGVWDRKHGITNNQFTAAPFARYPTVFTQLERARPGLKTQSIATWDQIATMAGSGSPRADVVVSTAPAPHDPDESRTDAATAAAVVTAIGKFAPDLIFTHLDQVDRAGHESGGASRAYLDAVTRVDILVGRIVAAVDARAAAHPAERWTIIVTADHGHLPKGGHGGQSPDETTNFVIARGLDFRSGTTSTRATLVDITPTVLDIFDVAASPDLDGRSLRPGSAPIRPPSTEPEPAAVR
ncbi:alkaline phosphatase family protein [Nocardia sp. NBC_00508]|uniref:alkaline phosphatase family protein n=1 Tax=Nocardia sp. NBC_00508 TaxID=2975992 RepID=UPI002E80053F|nr:alkaline phosphatase family protein [Nocardia sp. NBC_00508]WUD65341.1 alkaline phosphatase family protein [Nocardia sp. NBC_00508]